MGAYGTAAVIQLLANIAKPTYRVLLIIDGLSSLKVLLTGQGWQMKKTVF